MIKKKLSFTLVGVLITLVVLAILLTLGSPLYLNAIENAKAKVCATNLKALKMAVEAYGIQQGALPGSLSQLRPQDLKKAWAKLFKKENPLSIKIAYFLVDLDKRGMVYATTASFQRFSGLDLKTLTCPDDDTPPSFDSEGNIKNPSYGLNSELVGISWKDYKKKSPSIWVVADCDSSICSTYTLRHKKYSIRGEKFFYGQYVRKDNRIEENINTYYNEMKDRLNQGRRSNPEGEGGQRQQ